ncbi:MAG: GerMN domain-containing protein [Acidimicrobiia bacterium]
MAPSLTRAMTTVVVLAVAAAATACGVREQSSPVTIDSSEVPFGLVETPPTPERPLLGDPAGDGFTVYLLGSELLVPVLRQAPHRVDLVTALATLAEGPTADEVALGLHSAVGPESPARPVRVEGDAAVLELSDAFLAGGGDQIAGLAQIVFTLTGASTVERVQFLLDGQSVEVPRGDGVLTTEPVSRTDYAPLAPSP